MILPDTATGSNSPAASAEGNPGSGNGATLGAEGPDPASGASPATEPSDPVQLALQRASMTERRFNQYREATDRRFDELLAAQQETTGRLVSLLERGSFGNGQAAAEPAGPPHTDEELMGYLTAGDHADYHRGMAENMRWELDQRLGEAEKSIETRSARRASGEKLMTYLRDGIGFGSTGTERDKLVAEEARKIKAMAPDLDAANVEVMARANVFARMAQEDLRGESNGRTRTDHPGSGINGGQGTARGGAPAINPNWDAPNRGLPPEIVAKINRGGQTHALAKSDNPVHEAAARKFISSVVATHQARKGGAR